jgi:hypothetical protein
MMTEEEEDTRPEDWYAKDSDIWVFGGFAFLVTMAVTSFGRDRYEWYVTALFSLAFWLVLTHSLIDSAYRIRRRKDKRKEESE